VREHHHVAQRQQRQVDGRGGQGRGSGHGKSLCVIGPEVATQTLISTRRGAERAKPTGPVRGPVRSLADDYEKELLALDHEGSAD
jgi:hypothetical protein